MRNLRSRGGGDCPIERQLGGGDVAGGVLQPAEIGIRERPRRVRIDRLFHLADGAGDVLQARERIAEEDLGPDILWVSFEHTQRSLPCIVVLSCAERYAARLTLRIGVL